MGGENLKQLIIRTNLVAVILLPFHVYYLTGCCVHRTQTNRLNYEFVLKDARTLKKIEYFFRIF